MVVAYSQQNEDGTASVAFVMPAVAVPWPTQCFLIGPTFRNSFPTSFFDAALPRAESIDPSQGAISGGFIVTIALKNIPLDSNITVFFGTKDVKLKTSTRQGMQLTLWVIASQMEVPQTVPLSASWTSAGALQSISIGTFVYELGCLDYAAFCNGLGINVIPHLGMLILDPPRGISCESKYCIDKSDVAAPSLQFLNPSSGPDSGGTTVLIVVENLFAYSPREVFVRFGSATGTVEAVTTSSSIAEIVVKSPASPLVGEVEITLSTSAFSYPQTQQNLKFGFMYTHAIFGPPLVEDVYPQEVPSSSSTNISVILSNLPSLEPVTVILAKTAIHCNPVAVTLVYSNQQETKIVLHLTTAITLSAETLELSVLLPSMFSDYWVNITLAVVSRPPPEIGRAHV